MANCDALIEKFAQARRADVPQKTIDKVVAKPGKPSLAHRIKAHAPYDATRAVKVVGSTCLPTDAGKPFSSTTRLGNTFRS